MSFFTIAWQAPADIGLLPQHPTDGQQPFFTIGWTVKQQATWYPWDPDDLVIKTGTPDPEGGGGNETPGGGTETPGGGGTETPGGGVPIVTGAGGVVPSPQIRPRVAQAYVAARKDPGLFRRKGLTFALSLEAPATVMSVLVTADGKRKLTYEQRRRVTAGTDHLTLRPTEAGKLATRTHRKVAAQLRVIATYADGSRSTVTRSVSLAPPRAGKR